MTTQAQPQTMQMATHIQGDQRVYVGLHDTSASTGSHWKVSVEPKEGLKISDELFFPKNDPTGAPAMREYTFVAEPSNVPIRTYHVTLLELPPTGNVPVNKVDLTINVGP